MDPYKILGLTVGLVVLVTVLVEGTLVEELLRIVETARGTLERSGNPFGA